MFPKFKTSFRECETFSFYHWALSDSCDSTLGWLECVARQAPPTPPHPVPGSWIIWQTVECEDISALDCFTANSKLLDVLRTSWLPSFSSSSGRHSLKILLHWMSQRWFRPLDKISTNSSECRPVVFPTHLKDRVNLYISNQYKVYSYSKWTN